MQKKNKKKNIIFFDFRLILLDRITNNFAETFFLNFT